MKRLKLQREMFDFYPVFEKICTPILEKTPIKVVDYLENFPNGEYLYLATNAFLYDDIICFDLLEQNIEELLNLEQPDGFNFWSDEQGYHDIWYRNYKVVKEQKNPLYGWRCEYVIRDEIDGKACKKTIGFMLAVDARYALNFYMSNTQLLKKFAHYVDEQLQSYRNHFTPIVHSNRVYFERNPNLDKNFILKPDQIFTDLNKHNFLSERELSVVKWYLKGKTVDETSMILGISINTIDTYFKRIKAKLNVSKKQQIIYKLLEPDLFFEKNDVPNFGVKSPSAKNYSNFSFSTQK